MEKKSMSESKTQLRAIMQVARWLTESGKIVLSEKPGEACA
ncbi:hypothetical protein PQQ72_03305 [Paraburkholderia strydomiana]